MTKSIKTYSLAERARSPDFAIHDERHVSRLAEAHRHEYFQVQLNLAGDAVQHVGAVTRPFKAGSLSFVLPYRVHRVPHPPGARFYVINFHQRFLRPELDVDALDLDTVPIERAPELAPFLFQEFLDFSLAGADLERARAACERMAEENAARGYCSLEVIRAELLLVLALVCRRHEAALLELARSHAQRRSRREALSRVIRHVRENLAAHISLADAAKAVDLSPNYLAHLVKKETGKTFVELVTERRMARAQELLAHTDMRIAEIAQAVGFDDEAYFARRFRQWFGLAPSVYRARGAVPRARPTSRIS